MMFWTGVGVLFGGVFLFGYSSLMIPSLFERMRGMFAPESITDWAVNQGMSTTLSPVQILEQQLFLMQLLQLIGLVMAASGAIVLVYGLGVTKQEGTRELSQWKTG